MRPVLHFTSLSLCELCKSIEVDFSKPSQPEHGRRHWRTWSPYYEKLNPVRIPATLRHDARSGSTPAPYKPSLVKLAEGRDGGCPLCAFLLGEVLHPDQLLQSTQAVTRSLLKRSVIQLEFTVPAAYQRGGSKGIRPASFKKRFLGPYSIRLKVSPELANRTAKPDQTFTLGFDDYAKEMRDQSITVDFDGYTNLDPSRSLPSESALSSRNIERIKRWLRDCDLHHEECKLSKKGVTFVPSRLIDVGTAAAPQVTLFKPDRKVSYAALSYCWGKLDAGEHDFRTTKTNIQSRICGDLLPTLPATLRDACDAARALDLRYIWIDSLCIIQDDFDDWKTEAGKMGEIYSNARITFAATSSDSVKSGLALIRPMHRLLEVGIAVVNSSKCRAKLCIFTPRMESKHYLILNAGYGADPWNSRAWTLQERLLSSRILHFTTRLLFFECRQAHHRESHLHPGWRKQHWISRNTTDSDMQDPYTGLSITPYDLWYGIISHDYCQRKLTFGKDRLPAISGLASELHSHIPGDEYLAGLWKNDLAQGLLWRGLHGTRKCPDYQAPSWSWASVGADIYDIVWPWARVREGRDAQITLLGTTSVLGNNPNDRIRSGYLGGSRSEYLVVSGKLLDGRQIYSHELHDKVMDLYFMRDSSPTGAWLNESSGQAYLDSFEEREQHRNGAGLRALLVLASFYHREEADLLIGLLLRPVGNSSDPALQSQLGPANAVTRSNDASMPLEVYERAGCFHMLHRDGLDCTLTFDVADQTIILV